MNIRVFIVALSLFALLHNIKAQDYDNAIGARIGRPVGLTVKHFMGRTTAVEGIVGSRWGGILGTLLFEKHVPLAIPNLSFVIGGGGHVGYVRFSEPAFNWSYIPTREKKRMATGIDGILGLEYTLTGFPINIGFDWKPAYDLFEDPMDSALDLALSVRYIF